MDTMDISKSKKNEMSALGGQIAALFAVGLTVFIALIGLGVDVGRALSDKTAQKNALEAVSEACMAQGNAVKYAQNPGDEARGQVIELLQANGYTGKATVWYAEAPSSETGAKDRYGGTLVELERRTPTTLLGIAGVDLLEPRSERCWVTHSYSSAQVWRPPTDGAGYIEVTMEDGRTVTEKAAAASFADAPRKLVDTVRAAI